MSKLQATLVLLFVIIVMVVVSGELKRIERDNAQAVQRMREFCAEINGTMVQLSPRVFVCRKGK